MTPRRVLIGAITGTALVLILGRWGASLYTEHRWYASLGAHDVWRAKMATIATLTMVSFAIAALFSFVNLYAVRQSVVSLVLPRRMANIEIGEEVPRGYLLAAVVALSVLMGGVLTISPDLWSDALLASVGKPFGEADPYFGADIGFFVYWLPFETAMHVWSVIVLASVAVIAALVIGRVPPRDLARGLAPLWLAAVGLAFFNSVFGVANADPSSTMALTLGPWRVTAEAIDAGVGLGLRVVAIGAVGAVFALTTDSTRLVDALVQQTRVSERFAYGALAAYGALPRFSEDLANLRAARRMRGLRGSWHPRILVGLLVLAIRHGDRVALAMDARAFGSGPRSRYRDVRWGVLDLVVGMGAFAILVGALVTGR